MQRQSGHGICLGVSCILTTGAGFDSFQLLGGVPALTSLTNWSSDHSLLRYARGGEFWVALLDQYLPAYIQLRIAISSTPSSTYVADRLGVRAFRCVRINKAPPPQHPSTSLPAHYDRLAELKLEVRHWKAAPLAITACGIAELQRKLFGVFGAVSCLEHGPQTDTLYLHLSAIITEATTRQTRMTGV